MASTAQLLEDRVENLATPTPVLELLLTNPGPPGANRRFVPRMNVKFIVRDAENCCSYEGIDISFGGLMCTGGPITWPGNVMELDLILPGEHSSVRVLGKVVDMVTFKNRLGMRVQFEGTLSEQRRHIAAWMARKACL